VPTSQLAHVQKRRSTRIDQAILLTVRGMDAFRAPYIETVPTLTLSCHGCRYRSKHEVILGDIVQLELRESARGSLPVSTQARVKWLTPITIGKEGVWDVAVELETPGNFWGVASPPEDWLLAPEPKVISRAKSGQELRVVSRSEQQIGPGPNRIVAPLPALESAPASLASFLAGLNEHVQQLVSEAATAVVVKEKESLIDQFRAHLQDEMTRTLDRAIVNCKEELVHRALKELTKELEASARRTQEHWVSKIEEGMSSAAMRITDQATQVSEHIENMAATAIERLQLKMDTLRREATDELKIGSLSICQQAEDFCQQSAQKFANQVQQRTSELKNQFESNVNERVARAGCELDQKVTAFLEESKVALLKLSEGCQESVRGQLRALAVSAVGQLANTLNERAAEIAKQRLSELQDCTRGYLESISGSIAEVSKRTAARRRE
jgi:hypothetical protein